MNEPGFWRMFGRGMLVAWSMLFGGGVGYIGVETSIHPLLRVYLCGACLVASFALWMEAHGEFWMGRE